MSSRFAIATARIFVSMVLMIAGILKILEPGQLAGQLSYVLGLPDVISAALADLLPFAEIFCGATLLFYPTARLNLMWVRLLTFSFLLFHIYIRYFHDDLECLCFGRISDLNSLSYPIAIGIAAASVLPIRSSETDSLSTNMLRGSTQKQNRLIVISLSFLVVVVLGFRYSRIAQELKSGMINHLDEPKIVENIERELWTLTRGSNRSEPKVLLFLRGPGCGLCVNELRFWLGKKNSAAGYEIVAVFPTSAPGNENRLSDVEGIDVASKRIDDSIYERIVGSIPRGSSTRILMSSSGKLVGACSDVDPKQKQEEFFALLDDVGAPISI